MPSTVFGFRGVHLKRPFLFPTMEAYFLVSLNEAISAYARPYHRITNSQSQQPTKLDNPPWST